MLNLEQPEKRNFSSRETSFIKYMTSHGLPTLCGGPNTEWKSESITIKYFYLTCAKIKVSRRKYNQRTYGSAYASKTNDVNQIGGTMLTPCPGSRASLSPTLNAFSRSKSTFTLLHPVTPSCGRTLCLCRNPTHCKIS